MRAVRATVVIAFAATVVTGCSGIGSGAPAAGPAPATAGVSSPAARTSGPTPGAAVPERLRFSGSTVDGGTFSGESLAGRTAVLWFWAPWCTVCRGEAPDIDAMRRRFGDRVRFVGVPGLGKVPDMQRFVADTGLGGFPHVVDADGSLWERFGVPAQPAFAFVGRDGTVEVSVGKLSVADLASRLDRLARG